MKDNFHTLLNKLRAPVASRQAETLSKLEKESSTAQLQKFSRFLSHVDDAAAAALCPVLARAVTPALIQVLSDYALRPDTFLQKTALQALAQVSAALRAPALAPLAQSTSPLVREKACILLRGCGQDGCIPMLRNSLADENPAVVLAALKTISSLHDVKAIPDIIQLLQRSPADEVCIRALETLTSLPEKKQFPGSLVLTYITPDRSTAVQTAAITALGSTGNTAFVDPLLEILGNRQRPAQIQRTAAIALGDFSTEKVARTLLQNCIRTDDVALALACKQTLQKLSRAIVLKTTSELMKEAPPALRLEMAILLGELALPESYTPLLKQFSTESHPALRAALIEALAQIDCEKAFPLLLEALSEHNAVSYAALSALGDHLSAEHLLPLMDHLRTLDDTTYWEAALSSLVLFGRANGIPPALKDTLVELFNSPHRHAAWLAAEVAGWMSLREITGDLIARMELDKEEPYLHTVICRAIMRLFQNNLSALADWLAPDHLHPLAAIISREVDLGRTALQLLRRLAVFCSESYPGSQEALLAAARLDPVEFAATANDVTPECVPSILQVWTQLTAEEKKAAPLNWEQWLLSSDPRLRRAAMEFIDMSCGIPHLSLLTDIAFNDPDVFLRDLAREAIRRIVRPEALPEAPS